MKAIGKVLVCVFLLMAVSAPGEAQEENGSPGSGFCGQELSPERLFGTWSVKISPIRAIVDGQPTYQGNTRQISVSIGWDNGNFLLKMPPPISTITLSQTAPDEPDWRWSNDPMLLGNPETGAGVTSKDMEVVYDCEIEDFPRLVGTFDMSHVDGAANNTMRVVVFDDDQMIGALASHGIHDGHAVDVVKSLVFERPSPDASESSE